MPAPPHRRGADARGVRAGLHSVYLCGGPGGGELSGSLRLAFLFKMPTMKAAWYSSNGSAREVLVVGDIPTPEPAAGQVRVRLHASGVNPSDVKSRAKRPPAWAQVVPHSDGAGVIDKVGPGVARQPGERVWIWNGQWQRPLGTAAQFIVLPSQQAVPLPDSVSFEEGACLGIPALTAIEAIRLAGDLAQQTVLVTGAGSTVGLYITQLAVRAGARVIGTASKGPRSQHAIAAGAAEIVDYRNEPVAERVKSLTGGRGVDVIIDMDFSTTAALLAEQVLKPHGRLVCYGSNVPGPQLVDFHALLWGSLELKYFLVYDLAPQAREHGLATLGDLLNRGALKHSIAGTFSLADIAAAHECVEAGDRIGTTIVTFDA